MGTNSNISWTDATWNPITGCTKISDGCKHCYAEIMAHRLKEMKSPNYANGFKVTLQPHMLDKPLKWKKTRMIFVNSMSDIFHKDVPFEYIQQIFEVMRKAHWHTFQILTKRSERLRRLSSEINWPDNVWMGVSVENTKTKSRIEDLQGTGAKVKFISFEPLLEKVERFNLDWIDWVIVGGESGPKSRPMEKEWIMRIKWYCDIYKTPFFFKQWGGVNKKKNGSLLNGKSYKEMPVRGRVR